MLERLTPLAATVVATAEELARLTARRPLPVRALQEAQAREVKARQHIVALSMQMPATASLAVALVRDTHNDEGSEVGEMAQTRLATYRRWRTRLQIVASHLRALHTPSSTAHTEARRALPMARSA